MACWSALREIRSEEGNGWMPAALAVLEEAALSVSVLGALLGPLGPLMEAPDPEDPREREVLL